jgi:hypothetical protein
MATITRTNGGARPADGTSFGNAQITGRQLTHYTVLADKLFTYGNGTLINYLAAGSDYEKLVLAIEQVGSIELLGAPVAGNTFRVAISGAAPSANVGYSSLQSYCNTNPILNTGAGVSSCLIAAFTY